MKIMLIYFYSYEIYHSGQEHMQGSGICYSPNPWHQAAQHGTSLREHHWPQAFRSHLSGPSQLVHNQLSVKPCRYLHQPQQVGLSQVTQKDWSSVSHSAKLNEIWSVTLVVLHLEVVKNICCKGFSKNKIV